jgi:hypothetical protein
MDLNRNNWRETGASFFSCATLFTAIRVGLFFAILSACTGKHDSRSRVTSDPDIPETVLNLKIETLDPRLKENSGIIMFRGVFWTINDSGNDPVLYAFHPVSGRVIQEIFIINARNRDWEEITQDNDHIYIGDFGNNNGDRTHLQIYIVSKSDLPANKNAGISAELISFQYGNRPARDPAFPRSAYDCEAFFAWQDSLYLFTKNWWEEITMMYIMPSSSGNYVVNPRSAFNTDGLVTAADISRNGKIVALLGHKDFIPFIWLFTGYEFPGIFKGHCFRIEFPSYYDLQAEGITIQNSDIVYISCERSAFPPQVYWLDLNKLPE